MLPQPRRFQTSTLTTKLVHYIFRQNVVWIFATRIIKKKAQNIDKKVKFFLAPPFWQWSIGNETRTSEFLQHDESLAASPGHEIRPVGTVKPSGGFSHLCMCLLLTGEPKIGIGCHTSCLATGLRRILLTRRPATRQPPSFCRISSSQ